jgi:DNA modification methylase/transcriptional regulator with XRE-family HTH domain
MSRIETIAEGITLHPGDCLDVLAAMADASVDSCVCDPPYHLTSIVKRFGKSNLERDPDTLQPPSGRQSQSPYKRTARGFMGKQWDGGDIAFCTEVWAHVLRVLKPGGHLLAFSGTRTYHRMVCAIEDAGFEIRDQIGWAYGSGFPKSHDVSKGIDKRRDWSALPKLQDAIKTARTDLGISQSEAARRMGLIGPGESLGGGGFMWFETGMRMPTPEQWPTLKAALGLGSQFDECFEEAEREITGTVDEWTDRTNYAITSKDGFRRDKPATDEAAQWQGWGTALKPAWEPVVMARKPLGENTVAANVLKHGTGAINIDGCRIVGEHIKTINGKTNEIYGDLSYNAGTSWESHKQGRWPANIVHDGSDEVVGAFPETQTNANSAGSAIYNGTSEQTYGKYAPRPAKGQANDSGSAARFFYTAKADADDRLGSKHPTVKPLDLMQWLVRLVTPPGGTVLDPFAGTGTTGEAAFREGFRAVLIEREPEYQNDIRRRMSLVLGGPDERRRESIKASGKAEGAGPLFEGIA